MSRFFAASLAGLLLCAPLPGHADSIELREIRELRQIVEQQSKQLETLAQQVAKLSEALGHQKAAPAGEASATPAPAPPAPPAAPAPEAPRAEAVPKHTVAKGETLTSIAKLYNITVSELQKLNKIENDRKLQIGQTLTIPAPKTPEPPSEKKENP
jgi:LysM repeat protein